MSAPGTTPGPWAVAPKGHGWDHFATVIPAKGPGTIATCHLAALSRDYAQTAADAHLIAASPALYVGNELLESLCAWLLHRFGPDSPEGREAQFRLVAAHAALAQARGEKA